MTNSNFTVYGTKTSVASGDTMKCIYDSDAGTLSFVIRGVEKGVAFSGITDPVKPMLSMKETSEVKLINCTASQVSDDAKDLDLTSLADNSSPELILAHPFTYSALLSYVHEKKPESWSILQFREQIKFFQSLQSQSAKAYPRRARWRDTRIILDNIKQTITFDDPSARLDAYTAALRKAYPYSQKLANQQRMRTLIKEARAGLDKAVAANEHASLMKQIFEKLLVELDTCV